ncbi:MAG: ABC transporter permease [Halieaceae bacterium]|jgi:spermidine/putrescine transport system permease protein|nr:ABC transporter permease [Halieaceae bacterium]
MKRGYQRYLGAVWVGTILTLLYVPIVSVVLVSLANTRYMRFPHRVWTLDAYRDAVDAFTTWSLHLVSLQIALCVVFLAVVLGTLGAMAFARYDWRGRNLFQRLIMLPIFFPQPVLGLALLLAFSALGITPGWKTAVVAHAVWIVPIVTLVISIRLFGYDTAQEEAAYDLGASRWQVAREITLPALWPGIFSGALFAFLLSWSNLPLSVFTSGADTPLPVWLFSRTATNYSPLVPAVAVIGTIASALVVISLLLLQRLVARLQR